MSAPNRFVTERLTGERVNPHHWRDLQILYADPQVMKTLGDPPLPIEETRARLDSWLDHWDKHGFGHYILRLRSGEFVGMVTLEMARIDTGETVEIGYALRPKYWNQGYATEAAKALLRIAFENVKLGEVYAFTLPANTASRRVMEKSGFVYQREFVYKEIWPSVLYRITAAQWSARS
jgi:RimJ/RimL family protein N-acetyltransferase